MVVDGNRVLSSLQPRFPSALCGQAEGWKVWRQEAIHPCLLEVGRGSRARLQPVERALRESRLGPRATHLWILIFPSRSKKGAKRTW